MIIMEHFDTWWLLVAGEERDDSSGSEDHYKCIIDSLTHQDFIAKKSFWFMFMAEQSC